MDILLKYFPKLSDKQKERFLKLQDLYSDWNSKINVISRKDIDELYERHILHSLAIAKYVKFTEGSSILDIGTGGGFPGIPLAILFPKVNFHLTDSIGKKIRVVNEVAQALGLENVKAEQIRSEEVKGKYDFVVSRAVAPFEKIREWADGKISVKSQSNLPNGIICLKGGDLSDELKKFKKRIEVYDLSETFEEEFFVGKKLVYWAI